MENFDDMYNSPPDGSEQSPEWANPGPSVHGSYRQATVEEIAAPTDFNNKNNSKISKIDLKRRAVLNFDSESVYSTLDSAMPAGPSTSANYHPDLSADEIEAKRSKQDSDHPCDEKTGVTEKRKIYVSGMPPNITEKPLFQYFSKFGPVKTVNIVRDKWTGISRGFGFVSFVCESDAESALNSPPHILEGRPIRVNPALENGAERSFDSRRAQKDSWMDTVRLPSDQTRIYVGPLDDDVTGGDLQQQFVQFGTIRGVSRLRGSEMTCKRSYGIIDFYEAKSVMRSFGSKIFVKGKHVKVALSRLAMEVLLSTTVVYFYDAHLYVDEDSLEKYFSQYGQVFRTIHLAESDQSKIEKEKDNANIGNKNYGFVDFIAPEAAKQCVQKRTQLIPPAPGQVVDLFTKFVRLGEYLPTVLLYDFLSMSEKDAAKIVKKLEKSVPNEGIWGSCHPAVQKNSSQVRVPAALISRLIGERGKTISEICRDSKTKISVPKVKPEDKSVIIQINGSPENIKIAQYLMQKVLKGNR